MFQEIYCNETLDLPATQRSRSFKSKTLLHTRAKGTAQKYTHLTNYPKGHPCQGRENILKRLAVVSVVLLATFKVSSQ